MTLKRSLLVYIKTPLLILLVGVLYWPDFLAFWQTTISTGWIINTLVILFLVLVFLFQRRNALKTLFLISESHNGQGAGLVLLALVLYVVGSYTPYALWLHWCSLIVFIAGCLALIIDFRIPRMFFLPFVALLFVFPPIGIEIFEVQNLLALVVLYLSADAVIVALVAYIVSASKWWKWKASDFHKPTPTRKNEIEGEYCPPCRSDMFKEEVFCSHCGRQRSLPKLKPFKFAFMKFLVLLLIVFVLAEFRHVGISIFNWLDFVSRWTIHYNTLHEIYVRFKDVFFAVVGAAAVLVFAGWVRAKDEKVDKLVENASILMEDEATLLVAILKMKPRRLLGKELFDAYQRIAKSEADLKGFHERLRKMSMSGLIEKDYVLKNGELVMVWKRMFP